jgi:hypothetical protein
MKKLWNVLFATTMLVLVAGSASAQTVIGPTKLEFTHSDADLTLTGTYHLDFFQCASITPAVPPATQPTCNGQATTPSQSSDVPKASVTTLSPPDGAANRSISLTAPPANGNLAALPAGVPFVSTIIAVADPNVGGSGQSPRSAASNPFFSAGKTPAQPTGVVAK